MLMNKEDNKKIYEIVSAYTETYKKCPLVHRKMAKILNIKDWEAFECQRAMVDLENFDEEKIKAFSLQCNSLTNIEQLMKEFEIHKYTVRYLLHIIDKQVGFIHDGDFFFRDTPESFYWAGFVAADGCVESNSCNLVIGLAEKDRNHLEKFKISMSSNHHIESRQAETKGKIHQGVAIRIGNLKLREDLKRFNIGPRKTDVYYMPDWLVVHPLLSHFIRGYFDGDGSFFVTSGGNNLTFSLCGIEHFLQQCQKIFGMVGLTPNKIQNKGETKHLCEIQHRGTNVVRALFDYMYRDSNENIRMDRKYDLAKNYLDIKEVEKQDNTTGKRISVAKTGKHPFRGLYKITTPDGTTEIIKSLRKYCIEHGLGQSSMFGAASGNLEAHNGYKCEKLPWCPPERPTLSHR